MVEPWMGAQKTLAITQRTGVCLSARRKKGRVFTEGGEKEGLGKATYSSHGKLDPRRLKSLVSAWRKKKAHLSFTGEKKRGEPSARKKGRGGVDIGQSPLVLEAHRRDKALSSSLEKKKKER